MTRFSLEVSDSSHVAARVIGLLVTTERRWPEIAEQAGVTVEVIR